jgi:hypothetical protein
VTATLDGDKRYRENYRAEIDSAALSDACAASEERQPIAAVYRRLAARPSARMPTCGSSDSAGSERSHRRLARAGGLEH